MSHLKGILLATALVAGVSSIGASAVHAEDVVIGVPIAQTGPIAFVGVPGLNAMKMAADEANEAHVLGAGRTIKLVTGDDASDRTQSVTLVNKMIQSDKALVICGLAGTTMALAGSAVGNEQQVPLITMATSATVTAIGKYAFHVMASPDLQIASALTYVVNHYKPKTVATIWGRDNEGAASQGKYARQWLNGKVTLLPEETTLTADTDFTALATKMAFANPDVIFLTPPSQPNGANMTVQLRQGGVKSAIVGSTAIYGPGYIKTAGKAAEGVVAVADYTLDRPDALNQNFVADYTKRYNMPPDNWAALGYTAMQVAIQAIKDAGPNPTGPKVRDAMEKIKNMPAVTGSGLFSFDKDREPAYDMALLEVKDGKWVAAPK